MEEHLGVLFAKSQETGERFSISLCNKQYWDLSKGNLMIPFSWMEMICPVSGQREPR
jgi:hypothetical protein